MGNAGNMGIVKWPILRVVTQIFNMFPDMQLGSTKILSKNV